MTIPSNVHPRTNRSHRVIAILSAARVERDFAELREDHLDWWPHNAAGDRKWSRDRRDALDLRVTTNADAWRVRHERAIEWLAARPGATTVEIRDAMGLTSTAGAHNLLNQIGAAKVKERARPRHRRWTLADA